MKLGPRYKIAKRLGAPIFEKTQTQRFALSQQRSVKRKKSFRNKSDFSRQLLEKQKLRLTYGLTEKQFASYVKRALESHQNPQALLFGLLEKRLDSFAYRAGLAPTRRAARQMASHGHLAVNGRRVSVPSYRLSVGDLVSIREGSREGALFGGLSERLKEKRFPGWLSFNAERKEGKLESEPSYAREDTPADLEAVFEYYTR